MKKIDPAEAARWLAKQLVQERKEVPQGQAKGAFQKGPRAYLACVRCTKMSQDPKRPGKQVGVAKQYVRQHIEAHRLGLIRKVTS